MVTELRLKMPNLMKLGPTKISKSKTFLWTLVSWTRTYNITQHSISLHQGKVIKEISLLKGSKTESQIC